MRGRTRPRERYEVVPDGKGRYVVWDFVLDAAAVGGWHFSQQSFAQDAADDLNREAKS
jgi:hypothetical protein